MFNYKLWLIKQMISTNIANAVEWKKTNSWCLSLHLHYHQWLNKRTMITSLCTAMCSHIKTVDTQWSGCIRAKRKYLTQIWRYHQVTGVLLSHLAHLPLSRRFMSHWSAMWQIKTLNQHSCFPLPRNPRVTKQVRTVLN